MLIRRALEEGPFSMQQLAEDAGVSYDTLYSWARGRRAPQPEGIRQLAEGLRRRRDMLDALAEELDQAAGEA